MTLPTHRGPNNLPVGIQLVAQRYEDDRLFACARWVWDKIGAPEMIGCRLVSFPVIVRCERRELRTVNRPNAIACGPRPAASG